MSKQIFINGEAVDLNEKDNPIAASYAVNNLAEIKDRQAYATNSFKLPKTQNNIRICGLLDSENFINSVPYRNNTAKIVQNGIEIISNGVGVIKGSDDFIQVQILSGIKKFFESIEEKKLNELNMVEFDHVFDTATIHSYMFHTTGVIYPLLDYGQLTVTGDEVNTKTMRPGIFLHTIINKIFQEAGYTFSGDIFSDEMYLKEIIPFSLDKFVQSERGQSILTNNNIFVSKNVESSGSETGAGGLVFKEAVPFGIITVDPGNHWQDGGTMYIADMNFTGRIRVGFDLSAVFTNSGNQLIVRLEASIGGVTWNVLAEQIYQEPGSADEHFYPGQVFEVTHNFTSVEGVRLAVYIDNGSGGIIISTVYRIAPGATFSVQALIGEQILPGQSVQMEATLPDIDQKNLIKDLMQRKGLTAIQDPYRNHMTFVNISKVYDNKVRHIDWTDKFSDKSRSINYVMDGYGIQNWGRFKKDNTVTDNYGDGFFMLDNQTLKNKVDLFTSVFAATESIVKLDGQVFSLIKKTDLADGTNNFSGKNEPRILINRIKNCTVTLVDDFGGSIELINGSIPYFTETFLPGLSYTEEFERHYSGLVRMLFRPFIIKTKVILNEYDIASLDWTIPVYNSNTATYYYLNEINNYIEGQPTEVGLIKL